MLKRCVTATAIAFAALTLIAASASSQGRIRTGVLDCRGAGTTSFIVGSSHQLLCIFHSDQGVQYRYLGLLQRIGVDVGVTQHSALEWAVFAPTNQVSPGDLAGNYAGVTAGAAFGVGANANALIGGSNNSFALQPVSFEGQTGVNVAVGVAGLELRPADAWPRPIRRAAHMHRVRRHHRHAA
jgi:hypothetical protein